MENSDIFLFTGLVVPAFIAFIIITIKEFSQAGKKDYQPQADARLK